MIDMMKIHEHARALYHARGAKAQAEAAQKARQLEETGAKAEADIWRAIQRSISEMRGAHQA
ncbi:hypothetical protein SAMN05421759_10796 [Roseivivax lentus]|uniref:Uncharacterized protein n=1 Tax=Roseivivax lentus TaxID=633194 RepID=A0A1N7N9D6_9RHOB|nr:hypothetical protein [Roseivivax lentus]SIS94926.1 hypothetical protein SAMN05421759_10796 [Roseivivax lentus]